MIRSNVDRHVRSLEKREPLVASASPHRYMRPAPSEADKSASAIAREAERVRVIRLLVGGSDEG